MTAITPTIPRMLHAYELTPEHKAEYIELIYNGLRPDLAARAIGTTGTQFKKLRNPVSEHYDADFAAEYTKAITSEEHDRGWLEKIRDWQAELANAGNARIIEKLSLIYDPAWEPLRHANLNVNVRAEIAARVLPSIPFDVLQAAIAAEEEKQGIEPTTTLRALPEPEGAE